MLCSLHAGDLGDPVVLIVLSSKALEPGELGGLSTNPREEARGPSSCSRIKGCAPPFWLFFSPCSTPFRPSAHGLGSSHPGKDLGLHPVSSSNANLPHPETPSGTHPETKCGTRLIATLETSLGLLGYQVSPQVLDLNFSRSKGQNAYSFSHSGTFLVIC